MVFSVRSLKISLTFHRQLLDYYETSQTVHRYNIKSFSNYIMILRIFVNEAKAIIIGTTNFMQNTLP